MAFKMYQKKHARWLNPFQNLDPPRLNNGNRNALPEDEMLRLFAPGALKTTMELAVCAAMFLSGLRRAEIAALRPEDLDWHTPKIAVRRAWQNFDDGGGVDGAYYRFNQGEKIDVTPRGEGGRVVHYIFQIEKRTIFDVVNDGIKSGEIRPFANL
jgi:integrase